MLDSARLRLMLVLAAASAASGCLRNPKAEAAQLELNVQVTDAINQIRIESGELHGTVDSLRMVIARQDTTIQRLAAVTGVPVVK